MLDEYMNWFEKNQAKLLEDFFTFLRFPSVSTDPAYKKDLLACKDWLCAYMESIGLKAEVWETSGYPTVFGSYEQGEGPTLLFYGHYDVQPDVPLDEWKSPPFEPEVRDNVVYARGAIDNKGQGFYTLIGIRAFLEPQEPVRHPRRHPRRVAGVLHQSPRPDRGSLRGQDP